MFRLQPADDGKSKDDIMNEVKKRLESLPSSIPVIRSMEVGVNVVQSERAYDLALVSTFDDLEALETYRVHPAHQEVVAFIARYKEASAAVDFLYEA